MDPRTASRVAAVASGHVLLGYGAYRLVDYVFGTGRVRRPYWNFGPAIGGQVVDGWGSARSGHLHEGIDIPAPEGTPVHAVGDGVVLYASNTIHEITGRAVVVEHEHGLTSLYAHLYRASVPEGTRVRRGRVIGRSGNTGASSGPHLHLGCRILPEALVYYERLFGRPRTGYGRTVGGRISVPAEPLVPVTDGYRDGVVLAAAERGVLLYAA
jgi:murein DD-endopeptidase MepM/ murein hydrolase activator NlpD